MDLVSEFGLLPKLLLPKVTETLFGVTIIVVEKFTVRFGFRLLFWTTPVWGETFPVIETGQIGNTFWRQGGKITQVLKYLIKQTNKTPLYFRLSIFPGECWRRKSQEGKELDNLSHFHAA